VQLAMQWGKKAQQQPARLLQARLQQAAGRGPVLHHRQMQTQQTGVTAVLTASSGSNSTVGALGQHLLTQVQRWMVVVLLACWVSAKLWTTHTMLADQLLLLQLAGPVLVAVAAAAAGVHMASRRSQMLATATHS
jgi:hypothetical protein